MRDDGTMRPWITERICEALDQANLARLAASDLEDHVLIGATLQLADDLETFALTLAARLSEIGEAPGERRPSPAAPTVSSMGTAPPRGRHQESGRPAAAYPA